ncbi:MAG: nucleoside kinase [Syntrophomonadaceae bacterium]|jgi:uridine kinase
MSISEQVQPTIDINIKGVGTVTAAIGSSFYDIYKQIEDKVNQPIMAGVINNKLIDFYYRFYEPCNLELVDTTSETGLKIYRRSALFLLLKACRELYPERKLIVKHSLSNGLFCEFLDRECSIDEAKAIENKMKELQARNVLINKHVMETGKACQVFTEQDKEDKVKLLEYRNQDKVNVYEMDGLYEYFYGYMAIETRFINQFRVLNYPPGIILQTPELDKPREIKPYIPQHKLASIFAEAKSWAEMLDTPHLAALNEIITRGQINNIIWVNEALHEKKIAQIADMCNNKKIRLILISGPSSSGKTTFAQRLLIQLRVNGRRPVSISLDNYFVNREMTPKDEYGEYDFEALESLNLELFNDHLNKLIRGEAVEMPIYNFKTGISSPSGFSIQVPDGEPIIIEGIHGLNDRLTWAVPREQKFKIYVSALTQLNIDNTNRIPTTDSRLIRRIVRDSRTRGHNALNTIKRWPSVRRGEEKNIFPFQENADVIFNSSLVYELPVLKQYAEPLLAEITDEHPEYIVAKHLLKFLSYVRPVSRGDIPPNSILREFIGGSWFKD